MVSRFSSLFLCQSRSQYVLSTFRTCPPRNEKLQLAVRLPSKVAFRGIWLMALYTGCKFCLSLARSTSSLRPSTTSLQMDAL